MDATLLKKLGTTLFSVLQDEKWVDWYGSFLLLSLGMFPTCCSNGKRWQVPFTAPMEQIMEGSL